MFFEVTVLGSSSALPTSRKFPSAHVLNVHGRFYLIDCGEGTQIQLRKFGIKLGKLNTIFISHMHGDHVFGLFGLFSTLNLLGRETPLHLYGHEGLGNLIRHFQDNYGQNLSYSIVHHKIKTRQKGIIFEDNGITVETFPLKHRIPTNGFCFREKPRERNLRKQVLEKYDIPVRERINIKNGADFIMPDGSVIPNYELTLPPKKSRSYAYVSDTRPVKNLVKILKGIDLLYHESTFLDKDAQLARQTEHTTALQAAEIARDAEAGKLLLGHLSTRYKDEDLFTEEARKIFENSFVVREGEKYVVELTREE